MKTKHITPFMLSSMIILFGCTKNNLTPVVTMNSGNGIIEEKTVKQIIKPENFVLGITNQYFPLTPGDTLYYQTVSVEDGDSIFEDITIAVTSDIKVITGINCTVVHDVATEDGEITEDTYDWYAQDIYGNVWYFGEYTQALQDDGSWSTEGSFENGVDGAVAGIIMPGNPHQFIGQTYRQEHYVGHAQDKATILSTDETVTIGYGTFTNCVKTLETTPLEPGVEENKWYAPGIGEIKASIEVEGDEHEELTGKNF
ncbi:MAG TPA: hypothetical protein VE978_22355 [Chitinophagales bacterium]|nr:hypothetical protein [Chitinophagales bacterium]